MKASYRKKILNFKQASGTSRGVLHSKETFILTIENGDKKGIGECALFRGLSSDDRPDYEQKLQWLCNNINESADALKEGLRSFPSIWIGYEQAMKNLENGGDLYFPSLFTNGDGAIRINGLIWMGRPDFMRSQIQDKLDQGFYCIKLKIGVDWNTEREILRELRRDFPAYSLQLRVDANGGFGFEEAKTVLEELAALEIHSIEQPIKAGTPGLMTELCAETPTPIALDEELIGINNLDEKERLLKTIQPQYIILKPSLHGGFSGSDEWIDLAEENGIGWWITSALESNIGLNAIAQFTFTKKNPMPQGLGTGALFTNNFQSSLKLEGDLLSYQKR